jgi:hypothetical protein
MFLRIFSIVLLALGLSLIALGGYTSYQAGLGSEKVSAAETQAEEEGRPTLGPIRRRAHMEASQSAQQKIGAENQKIALSELNATWLYGGGIALFLIGIASFLCSRPRST